jgi:Arc/MetJ family transcription regulator
MERPFDTATLLSLVLPSSSARLLAQPLPGTCEGFLPNLARPSTCGAASARSTSISLDDELVAEAQRLTGTSEKSALVREALRALIQRESARRLARLGGSEPGLTEVPRRRAEPS